jgi:hypothetical protein
MRPSAHGMERLLIDSDDEAFVPHPMLTCLPYCISPCFPHPPEQHRRQHNSAAARAAPFFNFVRQGRISSTDKKSREVLLCGVLHDVLDAGFLLVFRISGIDLASAHAVPVVLSKSLEADDLPFNWPLWHSSSVILA